MITEKNFHKAAWSLYKVGYRNVRSSIYPDMRHEVLNEVDKLDVWNEILDFMRKVQKNT
jgi:alpha-beta hydrolase superfamily lysophospholipase